MLKLTLPLVFALLTGCAHGPPLVGRPGLTTLQQAEMPAPTRVDLTAPARPYVIGPFDRISVEVYGIDELRREIEADAGGRISYPIAGSIDALGMTPAELETAIGQRLRNYVRDPRVTVNLIETVNNLVTVEGQVREPGHYPVVGRMTLMRAVASAKGLGEFARIREVVVFRTVQGQHYGALYDLGAIQRGAYADPEIFANDIVIVGDSPSRRFMRDLLQAAPVLVAPLIAVLQGSRN